MIMELEKIDEEDGKLRFVVKDSSPAMMNAIRRISMNQIPVLAIEDVGIIENSSALFDEIVAQRLGQIPLVFDPKKFDAREECDCEEGCVNCEAKFTLQKEGPGKVYSGDIVSESDDVEILYDGIPITELDENQEIELEATAIVSIGEDHSKHQAAISSYQYYPIIDVDQEELTDDEKEECVEVCPRNVFEVDDGKLKIVDEKRCTLCKECVQETDFDGITVTSDEEKFIFKIESVSSLNPEDILEKTAEILDGKAEKVIGKLG